LREEDKECIKSTVTRSLQGLDITRNQHVGWAIADAFDMYELICWQRRSWLHRHLTHRPQPCMSRELWSAQQFERSWKRNDGSYRVAQFRVRCKGIRAAVDAVDHHEGEECAPPYSWWVVETERLLRWAEEMLTFIEQDTAVSKGE